MSKQNHDRSKRPDLRERDERSKQRLQSMSDQEVIDRYSREMLKLKLLNQFGRRSAQFRGYPNTLVMNRCGRIVDDRNLPRPSLVLQEKEPGNSAILRSDVKH